jgi:hypothetical protein
MPDIFDRDGLQIKTRTELVTDLETGLRAIYGDDVTLDPDTPDGQFVGILAQAGRDLREVIAQVNSGFDPDQALGVTLDQRLDLNNIKRNGGTFTQTPVTLTASGPGSLIGLDDQAETLNPTVAGVYTVRDLQGNQFFLLSSTTISAAGPQVLTFRAENIGAVLVSPNTITTPVTVESFISAVNNPSGVSVQGIDEETDAEAKIRRRRSVAIAALGIVDSLEARISDLSGVSFARVFENDDPTVTDPNGVPPNSIWVVVEGGENADIGQIIYNTKPPGTGMRGDTTVDVNRPAIPGLPQRVFTSRFDRPVNQDAYIQFTLMLPGGSYDADEVERQIVEGLFWNVGQVASADEVTVFVKEINPEFRVTNMELSTDGTTYTETITPTSVRHRFINAADRITING